MGMNEIFKKYAEENLELARTIGQPVDPEKPLAIDWIAGIAEFAVVPPEEHTYYFDVLAETKYVVTMDSTGRIVQEAVSPDSESALTFYDLATKEFRIPLHSLLKSSEASTIGRKKKTITESLNREEAYRVIETLEAAADAESREHTLGSGQTRLRLSEVYDMMAEIKDYGSDFWLIAGTTVDNDVDRMEYDENKYHSIKDMFEFLRIKRARIPWSVSRAPQSGSTASFLSTAVCTATVAYMVAADTQIAKPIILVRREFDTNYLLGGPIDEQNDGRPQRLVLRSPNPVTVPGDARYLGVGVIGYEQLALACRNTKAVTKFSRS